jgi:hypothetical protein
MSIKQTEGELNDEAEHWRLKAALHDKRVLGLDILRFIAVSLVVFRHLEGLECPPGAGVWCLSVHKIAYTLNCGGWVGVDIFFRSKRIPGLRPFIPGMASTKGGFPEAISASSRTENIPFVLVFFIWHVLSFTHPSMGQV